MSDLTPDWRFAESTSKGCPTGHSSSKEEEMSIIDTAELAHWTGTCSATESSSLADIFQILADVHLQEPSLPLMAISTDDILTTEINQGVIEHGEPSTTMGKISIEELEPHKRLHEGDEQLSTELKREEHRSKRLRSSKTHNISERRRRGRINEKIRSLQQLIPNSNKRDCASILEEATSYLKTLKAQAQMMSSSIGTAYYNPYMPTIGIPGMQSPQYSTYVPFRPGMGLVPFLSPTFSPSGILPLVKGSTELCPSLQMSGTSGLPAMQPTYNAVHGPLGILPLVQHICPSQPISGTSGLPAVQPSYIAMPPPHFDNKNKENPAAKILKTAATGSQEVLTSGQIYSISNPSSVVHATHIVAPAKDGQETNK